MTVKDELMERAVKEQYEMDTEIIAIASTIAAVESWTKKMTIKVTPDTLHHLLLLWCEEGYGPPELENILDRI